MQRVAGNATDIATMQMRQLTNELIDEQGLSLDMDNNNLIIRLSLERMQTGFTQPIVRSIETSILLRN